MRDRAKPFVMYVGGGMTSFRFRPRGPKGWAQFGLWLALMVPALVWLADHLDHAAERAEFAGGIFLFAAGTLIWLVGGVWWVVVRAEFVNIVEVHRARHYERLERQRAERRERARAEQHEHEAQD